MTHSIRLRRCLAVLTLICVDQFSKLVVKAFVPATSMNSIIYTHSESGWFMFHIHPELHDRYPLPVDVVIAVLAMAFVIGLIVYLKHERPALLRDIPNSDVVKSSPRLTEAALALWTAGIICSTLFDAFIWGGSLDFICFEWAKFYMGAETYTVTHQFNCDLKDIFLGVGTLLMLIRAAIWQISLYKLPKADRKLISRRSSHVIKSIREANGKQTAPTEDLSSRNSVLDILVIVVAAVFFGMCLGYAIYVFSVFVIIPVAVEISPSLDALLTKIGRENDTEAIYNSIRSFCLMLGIFPGICGANTVVKNRERLFIGDTDGMIVTREGLKYHLRHHALYDVISIAGIVMTGFVLHLAGWEGVSPFGFLYDLLGIPLGLILSALIVATAQVCGIIYAQNHWRAEYFYGE